MSSTQLVSNITSSSAIRSTITTPSRSTLSATTTVKPNTKNSKSKFRPRLSPNELSVKISKYLSPNLFSRAPVRNPVPPSLAYSRLPPPCAELDPSPTHRIRRFKKWRDVVPELRLVLLDPKRRGHLVRYQTYAMPFPNTWIRGVKRRIIPRGIEIRDYAAWPTVESIQTKRGARAKASASRIISPATLASGSAVRIANPVKQAVPGTERRKERTRMKQHRWVLHAENERRWRTGMREIMTKVTYFQEGCMIESSKWKDGKGVWLPDYDISEVEHMTHMFRDIRRQPAKVFDISPSIEHVRGRKEAEAAIRDNEAERKKRKEERRVRRSESSARNTEPIPQDSAIVQPAVDKRIAELSTTNMTLPQNNQSRLRSSRKAPLPDSPITTTNDPQARKSRVNKTSNEARARPKPKSSADRVVSPTLIIRNPTPRSTPRAGDLSDTDLLKELLRHMTKLETRQRRNASLHAERDDGSLYLNGKDMSSEPKPSSETMPSLASSASSQCTINHPRYGSLDIDDDTLITPPHSTSTSKIDTPPLSLTIGEDNEDINMNGLGKFLSKFGLDKSDLSSEEGMGESDLYLSLAREYGDMRDTKAGSTAQGDTFQSY